jgi:ribonuclease P protein component
VHAENCAANAPDAAIDVDRSFGPLRRLRRPSEFAAVLSARREQSLRGSGRWLAMTAAWTALPAGGARLGLTISKRMARRAIDRALVKRIVREAFRHRITELEQLAAAASVRIDISVRLRRAAGLPDAQRPPLPAWRRELRRDADQLLAEACTRLRGLSVGGDSPYA